MASSKLLAIAMGTLLGSAAMAQSPNPAQAESTETDLSASNADVGPKGFEVGLRVGYALPLGDAVSGSSYSDFTKGIVPLQLDLGYRIDANLFAGAYFQYGFTGVKFDTGGGDVCSQSGVSCSATDLRFGIEGQYHLMPATAFDPWVGLGVGYEIYHASLSAGGLDGSINVRGFEFVNLAVGANYKLSPNAGVGPFVGLAVGEYTDESTSAPGVPDQSASIDQKGVHMALSFGLRGVFDVM